MKSGRGSFRLGLIVSIVWTLIEIGLLLAIAWTDAGFSYLMAIAVSHVMLISLGVFWVTRPTWRNPGISVLLVAAIGLAILLAIYLLLIAFSQATLLPLE